MSKDYIGQDYFFVVHDLPVVEEENYSVVYGKWLTSNNGCTYLRYPLLKNITKCLKQKKEPKEDWKNVEVKVIAIFDNLDKANQKLKKILNYESSTTDNTEHKNQRKKKGIHHHFEEYTLNSSSDEESDHLPQLPQLKWNKHSDDKLPMDNEPQAEATIVPNGKAGALLSESYNITTPNEGITISSPKENVTYAQAGTQKNTVVVQLLPGANNTIGSTTVISPSSDNSDNIQIISLEEAEFLTEHSLLVEIFKKLCSLETAIAAQDNKIHNILQSLRISVPNKISVDLPKLPIDTLDELLNLNAILDDQVIFDAMTAELRRFCGSCERDCVLKMLPRIFDFELARICSLKGRNNNFKLEGCKVLEIMRCAVKQNYPNMTYTIFNLAVTDWFRGAELRYKRKTKSKQTIIQQETEFRQYPEV